MFPKTFSYGLVFAVSMLLLPTICQAYEFLGMDHSQAPVVRRYTQISLGGVAAHEHYRENTPAWCTPAKYVLPKDSETGWSPGVEVSTSIMLHALGVRHILLAATGFYTSGPHDFTGRNDYGTASYHSTTEDHVVSYDAKLGKGFVFGRRLMVLPYVIYGRRVWRRRIEAYDGLPTTHERFSHDFLGVGANVDYELTERWLLDAGLMGAANYNLMFKVTYPADSPRKYLITNKPSFGIKLGAAYRLSRHWSVFSHVDYLMISYGATSDNRSPRTHDNVYVVTGLRRAF